MRLSCTLDASMEYVAQSMTPKPLKRNLLDHQGNLDKHSPESLLVPKPATTNTKSQAAGKVQFRHIEDTQGVVQLHLEFQECSIELKGRRNLPPCRFRHCETKEAEICKTDAMTQSFNNCSQGSQGKQVASLVPKVNEVHFLKGAMLTSEHLREAQQCRICKYSIQV